MKTVLLIEDEAVLRSAAARGLAKLPDLEVIAVGSMADAVAVLDAGCPDLVVSDIDLPDRVGLEILGELGSRGCTAPVIFVTAYLKAFRPQIPRHARVTVFEKPVALEALRAHVKTALGLSETAVAPPAPFMVADYLQLACMGRHSVAIEVARGDRVAGRVLVVAGEAWSARDARGSGEDAFRRLAFARDGRVACRTLVDEPGPRDLHRPWEAMLMDAARVVDETSRDGDRDDEILSIDEVADGDDASFAAFAAFEDRVMDGPMPRLAEGTLEGPRMAAPLPPGEQFAAFRDRGVEALLSKDYAGAWAAFVEAGRIRPDDPTVKANLIRLRDLGLGGSPAGSTDKETP
ncbi:MAG: response regulator [Deltaproteobacteria bacterium]|nr:response regulator [Deltaproteobacteria bacterium]